MQARLEQEFLVLCVAGADVGVYSREHLTPLSSAVKFGATAILRVLIMFGADLRCKNGQSFRPLLLAAETDQQGSFAVLAKALRATGDLGDVAADKGNGYTVLHFGAINNNASLLLAALEYEEYRDPCVVDARSSFETTGADSGAPGVDLSYVSNQTALHKACLYDFRDCAVVLLSHGANPNVADSSGRTPLHSTVTRNNVPLTRLLLDKRADGAGTGRDGGQLQTAPLAVVVHSFRLIFRRAIVSRSDLEA
jgi:ankyrin repeat protein